MPRPRNERDALEKELREELPVLLADHQWELAATPIENRERRERLAWQIRSLEKRLQTVETLLTTLNSSPVSSPPFLLSFGQLSMALATPAFVLGATKLTRVVVQRSEVLVVRGQASPNLVH